MAILCRMGRHRPLPSELWNHGYFFGRCGRCGCELIRRGPEWRPVPKGYRIVWKQRLGPPIDWTPWTPAKAEYHPRLSDLVATAPAGEPWDEAISIAPSRTWISHQDVGEQERQRA